MPLFGSTWYVAVCSRLLFVGLGHGVKRFFSSTFFCVFLMFNKTPDSPLAAPSSLLRETPPAGFPLPFQVLLVTRSPAFGWQVVKCSRPTAPPSGGNCFVHGAKYKKYKQSLRFAANLLRRRKPRPRAGGIVLGPLRTSFKTENTYDMIRYDTTGGGRYNRGWCGKLDV